MKKIFLASAFACLLAGVVENANAQGHNKDIRYVNTKQFMNTLTEIYIDLGLMDMTSALAKSDSEVDERALRDFNSRFRHASEAKWFSIPSGFLAYFNENGFQDRTCYDRKGHWQYTLKSFGENQLPKDIRKVIKASYYDFVITLVEEVDTPETKVYFVHIEDGTSIKNLRVSRNGEIETMSMLKKG